MTTKILGDQITNYTISGEKLSNTANAFFESLFSGIVAAPKVLYANVTSNTYQLIGDTTINSANGGFIRIVGSEFVSGASVMIDTALASAVSVVNSTTLHVQVQPRPAASYNLYVVNPDGGAGIRVNGITYADANRLFTWGRNQNGQLGLNNTVYRSSPTQVGSANTNWNQISGASYQRGFISSKTDGTLWSWGPNNHGQLGLNNTVYRSSPTQVGSDTNWGQIGASESGIAIKTDGTLWTWGRNANGQLGLNDIAYRSSPTQIGSATNWNRLDSSDGGCNLVTKTDGTLWAWGSGFRGALGLNDIVDRSSPVQVGATTNWNLVVSGGYTSDQATAAIKTDGTLWVWGLNDFGRLGINNTVNRSSPVQIGANTNWNQVSVSRSMLATKTDGTLWTWGRNDFGQLGLNDTVNRSSPVQIGANTNWNLVGTAAGNPGTSGVISAATKTDGTLWTWGRNESGGLGLNDIDSKSSPTQVGSANNWTSIQVSAFSVSGVRRN